MKLHYVIFLCIFFALIATGIVLFLHETVVLSTNELAATLSIDDVIGVTTDTTFLHFGKLPPGSSSERIVALYNPYPYPAGFTLVASVGTIVPLLLFNESYGILESHENTTISAIVKTPENASGNYSGTVQLTLFQQRYIILLSKLY